jgi:PAS domain S-box-containing protein
MMVSGASDWINKASPNRLIPAVERVLNEQRFRDDKQILKINKEIKEEECLGKTLFDELFNKSKNGIAIYEVMKGGEEFILSDINAAGETLAQLNRKNAIGQSIVKLFPGVTEDGLLDALRRVFSTGTPENIPATLYQDDRIDLWFDCRVSRISSGEIMIVFDNMNDYKKIEASLIESEKRYKSITELLTDYIYTVIIDGDQVIETHHGPGCLAVTGYSSEEFLADPYLWFHMVADEDGHAVQEHIKDLLGNVASSAIEHRIIRKDGQQGWIRNTPVICRDLSGKITSYAGFVQDISELKRAEQEKELLESRLSQAQKMEAMGTLAGGIAHDFNNILTSVMSYTELALLKLKEEKIIHYLEQVLKGCDRAASLVQQILTFSRHADPEKKNINIKIIVKEALKLLRSSLPVTIEIRQRFDCRPCQVLSDPTEIHQIIMNLCTNSAHAMRDKGGVLEVEISSMNIGAEQGMPFPDLDPGPYAQIVVRDEGHGIDPAIADKIFDPFFTTKGPGEGTGMGLSVVYGIVKKNGGAIRVESESGRGTTFRICFPLITDSEDSFTGAKISSPKGTGHILFVDDEAPICQASEETLSALGYTVDVFTDSEEALRAFVHRSGQYDLVITDMTMPKMTGIILAGEILKIRPDVPVIICTGYSESVSEKQLQQVGIKRLLMKPLKRCNLAMAVREVLNNNGMCGGNDEATPSYCA